MRVRPAVQVLGVLLLLALAVAAAVQSSILVIAFLAAAVGLPIAWRRPELPLAIVALLIPSGTLYAPLRIHVSTGYVTLFEVAVLAIATLTLFKPDAALEGISHPLFKFGLATMLAGLVAVIGAPDRLGALYVAITFSTTIMALSVALAQRVRRNAMAVHRTFVFLGLLVAGIAIYQAMFNQQFLSAVYDGKLAGYVVGGANYRPISTIGNALVASSVFVGLFALTLVTPYVHRIRLPALAVFATAVVASLSRSSIALLVAVVALYVIVGGGSRSLRSQRRRVAVSLIGLPVLLISANAVAGLLLVRLGERSFFQDDVRSFNAASAMDLLREHWLSGIGFGGYRRIAAARDSGLTASVDDQYLSVLVEVGVFGVFILLVAMLQFHRRPEVDGHRSWLPLAAIMGTGLVFEFLYHDATILLTSVFALDALSGRQRDQSAASKKHPPNRAVLSEPDHRGTLSAHGGPSSRSSSSPSSPTSARMPRTPPSRTSNALPATREPE